MSTRQYITNKWETVDLGEALFLGFGIDYEELDGGPGNYTAAILEWPDGKVSLSPVQLIRFLEPAA